MNYIYPIYQPILEGWSYLTEDKRFQEATQVPGNWHTKWIQNEQLKKADKHNKLYADMRGPIDFWTTLEDNWARFSIGAVLERWSAVRQAHGSLKCGLEFPANNQGALQALRSDGKFSFLRGNAWHAFQFWAVTYHAYKWSDGELLKFLPSLVLLDLAFYPLDTIKTLNYCDVKGNFRNVADLLTKQPDLFNKATYGAMWRGSSFKAMYNIIWGLNLWSLENQSKWSYIFTPLFIASYPLLFFKTRMQVIGSSLSHHANVDQAVSIRDIARFGKFSYYSGFLPWFALNAGFMWQFPKLINKEKRERILVNARNEIFEEAKRPAKFWI